MEQDRYGFIDSIVVSDLFSFYSRVK